MPCLFTCGIVTLPPEDIDPLQPEYAAWELAPALEVDTENIDEPSPSKEAASPVAEELKQGIANRE